MKKLNLNRHNNNDIFQVTNENPFKEVYIGFIDHDSGWRPRNESQKNEVPYSQEQIFSALNI